MRNGLLAALGVHAVVLPQCARKSPHHWQIVLPQHAENFQPLFRIALAVLENGRPRVLVKGLDCRSICPENGAHPPTRNDPGISKMSYDLGDRPLGWLRLPLQLLGRQAADQLLQFRGGRFLHFDCVLALDMAQDSLDILLCWFWHIILSFKSCYVPQPQPPRDKRRSSSTASSTALAGTSLTTSTFPISRGRIKCTTPFCVFLSD